MGVRSRPGHRDVDQALQARWCSRTPPSAACRPRKRRCRRSTACWARPGRARDLGSLLGKLQDGFSTLLTNPGNQTQQNAVVGVGRDACQGHQHTQRGLHGAAPGGAGRLVSARRRAEHTLTNDRHAQRPDHCRARPTGQSTADLENQRDAAVQTLSRPGRRQDADQPNGDLSILHQRLACRCPPTAHRSRSASARAQHAGLVLLSRRRPVRGSRWTAADVTGQLTGGQIGANIALRDTTLPTNQAELDEFAQRLSNRFAAQGLTLFTDASGNVPSRRRHAGAGRLCRLRRDDPGQSRRHAPTPALVRDGTGSVADDPAGATAFTPNPAGGPAGFHRPDLPRARLRVRHPGAGRRRPSRR